MYACVLSYSSCVWLFVTLWALVHQALSMGFSRPWEYWSGLPSPPPADLPDQGSISPTFAGGFFTNATWEAQEYIYPSLIKNNLPLKTRDKTAIRPNNPTTGHVPSGNHN